MSESLVELNDVQLRKIAAELRGITHGSSWSRTLATGELILKHFFAGSIEEWQTHRRHKEASIRRLANRPDCPFGRSALSEAVSIYVARRDLPECVNELTPSHVAIALRLPVAQRLALIEQAVTETWSVREMRAKALILKRSDGERRGRPRFSQARAGLSQLKVSLDALDSSLELLSAATEASADTIALLERALLALESKLDDVRAGVAALAGPSLRSAPKASLVVPAEVTRKRAVG